MRQDVTVLLVGVGGYGTTYVDAILGPEKKDGMRVIGVVDPYAKSSRAYPLLLEHGVPIYDRLDEFYAEHEADLAVISTPTHFHKPQTVYCMEHGSHVLCEKPVAASLADTEELLDVSRRTGKQVSVGYQWSHSQAIGDLKRDVLAGHYGKILRMKTIVLWPRNDAYYARGSGWGGKKRTPDGELILDSVASNATAHYLHNMLYVAGDELDAAAVPQEIEFETYRANPIETFDTCAIRVRIKSGAELLYLVTHAVAKEKAREPEFVFEFEQGVAKAFTDEDGIRVEGRLHDGTVIDYGYPNEDDARKLVLMRDVVLGEASVICGIEAASQHTKCMAYIEETQPDSPMFPANRIARDSDYGQYYVPGLDECLGRAYELWKLPRELDGANCCVYNEAY